VDLAIVRIIFVAVLTAVSIHQKPFGLPEWLSGAIGLLFGAAIIIFEIRLQRATLKRLIGAAVGSILGILGAFMMSSVIASSPMDPSTKSFLQILTLMLMGYVGLVVGANKGDMLNLAALGGLFGSEKPSRRTLKLLDTSVIIDGRLADICETGFIDGILVIPRFVLRELQLVADSADSQKRNRGRRGLDVLQRLQKMAAVQVQIGEEDYPHIRDVDLKLIELAKACEGKIVTNDFNLNKVAQLQGVPVLNINDLANALKPIVLPGEIMRVFILKEGKEYNQGVGYLDDGTMVVVDNARKLINRTVDVTVTSVLQTTAGKMIFGKYDERAQSRGEANSESNAEGGHVGRDRAPRPSAPASSAPPAAPTVPTVPTAPSKRETAVG